LFVYRVIYAAGLAASTGMLGTIVADYPQDVSRGKTVALGGMLNGLGVIFVAIFIGNRLPLALSNAGFDAVAVTRIIHVVVFLLCTISAIVVALGLKKGTPGKKKERPPWRELIFSGLIEGKNPRIALSYATAFVARSDLVILGIFLVLWGTTAGVEQGLPVAEAASQGARIFAIASSAAFVWLLVLGATMDRFNRVTGVVICMGVAAIGYLSMLLVDDPLAPEAIPFFILLGVGQISAFFGATTMISHEAPRLTRASVIGMFNMSGAVGITVSSGVGGLLFDAYGGSAPFALVGIMNGCVLLLAIVVRIKFPGAMPSAAGATKAGVD
jgi:MFS family permease